jgi:hypothetical protein
MRTEPNEPPRWTRRKTAGHQYDKSIQFVLSGSIVGSAMKRGAEESGIIIGKMIFGIEFLDLLHVPPQTLSTACGPRL